MGKLYRILEVSIEPDKGDIVVESTDIANKLKLRELQQVTDHLQSWIYDVAESIARANGIIKKEDKGNGRKRAEELVQTKVQ